MKDHYYSEKLGRYFPTRLDVLLYAHDGRGLGHASRTIGIGMALRRLFPDLRVLFVSGASISQSLIGRSGLDWIKLPSYASRIENGVSTGVDGPANFYKSVLGHHRSQMLAHIIESFKPGCVLVDHMPMGKREELMAALEVSRRTDTLWILGLRAVIGKPKNFWSDQSRQVFKQFYHSIFWYGDKKLLGSEQMEQIEGHFQHPPQEMGYVSRLYETRQLLESSGQRMTGTISLPWLSRKSHAFIQNLKQALSGRNHKEKWAVFINSNDFKSVKNQFADLSSVQVEPVGEAYAQTILNSDMAIIYGGYNSLMDVAAAGIPAIVVMREMKDREQDEHIQKLVTHNPDAMIEIQESDTSKEALSTAISRLLTQGKKKAAFNIQGSEQTARELAALL